MIKTLPQNIGRRNTFRSSGFFKNEINFYKLVLPELLEFQSEFRMTDPFDNTPNLFAAETDGENDFLAMEDLSVNGYNSYSRRQEGIDYNYFMSILNMFGKFHALSIAYKAHHPEEYESLEKLIFETYYAPEYETWYAGFWEKLCACAIDAVKKEFPGTIYENKIKEFAQHKTFQLMCNATNDNTAVRVISHGDSWTPNFLFNVNEDETSIKTKILDFQLARSASPVLDVSFFIYTTTSEKLRQDHYTNGLKYYHSIFSKQVSEMGCDPQKVYSFETFMSEVKKYSYFGLGFSLESIPVIVLEPDDAFQMDQIEVNFVFSFLNIFIYFSFFKFIGH